MTYGVRRKARWVDARQAAVASAARVSRARSSKPMAWSRCTDGNWRKNSSRGVPPFEVVEQRANRHPCAAENRRLTQNIGIPVHDLLEFHHTILPLVSRNAKGAPLL
jgi:hypothetical protein